MPHARISVVLTPLDEPGPHGLDDVEIRLASNLGAPAPPRCTRVPPAASCPWWMLAIEVVFARADPVPTFVFDEVHAGVGGKAAVEIGRRLAKLARLAQVILVTHLPQVAAFADNHLVVSKSSDGTITSTSVIRLGTMRPASASCRGCWPAWWRDPSPARPTRPSCGHGRRPGRPAVAR